MLHGFSSSRLHAVDNANRTSANDIAALVAAGVTPPTLPVHAGQSAQVLNTRDQFVAVSPGTSRTLAWCHPRRLLTSHEADRAA